MDSQTSSGGILNMSGCTRAKLQNATNGKQYYTTEDTTYLERQTDTLTLSPTVSNPKVLARNKTSKTAEEVTE